LSYEPLSDREKRILDYLKSKEVCGFNDMHAGLAGYTSRQTLRKDLDHLVSMQLVHEVKGRKGQVNLFQLGETVAKFELGLFTLLAEWKKLESELKQLSELVKSHSLELKKAGLMVYYLVYRAAFMTASLASIPDDVIPINVEKGLLRFSALKFNDFLERLLTFANQHPEIAGEFEKTSDRILKIVVPGFESIEGDLSDQTAKLKEGEKNG
jgi:hypothetical protein